MTEDEVLTSVRQHITEIRAECVRLQRLEARRTGEGVTELRRKGAADDGLVFDLCRLLFCPRDDRPLRQRWSVAWELIGGAKADDCPHAPLYVFQGVPFNIAVGLRHMGLVEPADHYLSYCLEAVEWNGDLYREDCRDRLLAAASELLDRGPWSRPLRPYERGWLLAQVSGGVPAEAVELMPMSAVVVGDPCQPPALDPRWRTADVVGVAQGIAETGAYDRLPLLADALLDAALYYCEHQPLRENHISVLSRAGDRFCLRWTAVTQDVNYYDGSKPLTRVEIEGEFLFKDISEWLRG
jgi:hypothetical protein